MASVVFPKKVDDILDKFTKNPQKASPKAFSTNTRQNARSKTLKKMAIERSRTRDALPCSIVP